MSGHGLNKVVEGVRYSIKWLDVLQKPHQRQTLTLLNIH